MDDITTFIIKIESSLSRLEAKLDGVHETLQSHERRITKLENKPEDGGSFRNDVIQLLVKAVLISICGFATLAGAGGVIAKILGN